MTRNNWIMTTTDVRPELVPIEEFGHSTSFVHQGSRRWTFDTADAARRFEIAVGEGRFRRESA